MNKMVVNDALEFIKTTFHGDYSGHDYFHTLRVYKMAAKIAEQENANLNPTKLSAVRSFYRMLLNPRKRLKTLGFKQVNNSFPFIRPHPLLRASRELAREKSREDIGF